MDGGHEAEAALFTEVNSQTAVPNRSNLEPTITHDSMRAARSRKRHQLQMQPVSEDRALHGCLRGGCRLLRASRDNVEEVSFAVEGLSFKMPCSGSGVQKKARKPH